MNAKQWMKATPVALLSSTVLTLNHSPAYAISCGDVLGPGGSYVLDTDVLTARPMTRAFSELRSGRSSWSAENRTNE